MSRLQRLLQCMVLGAALLSGALAQAATISGPSASTTGTFTLTWPAGYNLRPINGTWQFAAAPTTSYAFSNLPSGSYAFGLWL